MDSMPLEDAPTEANANMEIPALSHTWLLTMCFWLMQVLSNVTAKRTKQNKRDYWHHIERWYVQLHIKHHIEIVFVDWSEPLTQATEDAEASERHMEFQLAWFADPIFLGDYPASMRLLIGNRLPEFTPSEKAVLKGSWDYFGLNHYTSNYVFFQNDTSVEPNWGSDQLAGTTAYRNGVPIGPRADSEWLYVVPWGIHRVLRWIAQRYGNPPIYITENGVSVPNETNIPLPQVLEDTFRVDYYKQYIGNVSVALSEGIDVKGYFAWSFLDNFEWADGYTVRFGIHYVDYNDNLKRYAKASAKWFHSFITS